MTVDDITTPDETLIGRIIAGKFGLRRCVGTGASGSVYQADQLTLGRTVAVKILRDELTRDARFVARFHDEALAASRLNHPNTVSVIDYGQTEDGLLYLVMEFLRGPTLTQVLRTENLPPQRTADLVAQILAGLEEAHEAGVVHADLKSDNVVVERRRGDWDLVKVVDFGIARLVGKPTKNNAERTICGTPEYMAPEVIQGDDPTFASDLYAVGVVLYEILTGSTPFQGGASMDVLRRHITESPLPPSLKRPDLKIDPILEESAMRALSKEPRRRFATAIEFRGALNRVIGHRVERGAAMAPCSACGTTSPLSFKFCPDCGHPRQAPATSPLVMLDELSLASGSGPVAAPALPPSSGQTPTQDGLPTDFDPDETSAAVRVLEQRDLSGLTAGLPFVGRASELDRLLGFMTGGGEDNVLQVSGPTGSGRTRLIDEALAALGDGLRCAVARPDPSGLLRAFYPLSTLVRALLGFGPRITGEDLARMLEQRGLTSRDVPAIAALLGDEGPMLQLEPAVRRREILASLNRLLVSQADSERMVLVLEDVDRYDQPSQDVVRRLVETSRGRGRLRLVLSNGPDLAARWPDWVGRIELAPLDRHAMSRVADQVPGEAGPGSKTIEQLSGGSPAYAQHLVRYVVEGGAPASAPAGLADLIAARIDHLPHAAKRLCQAVAVVGQEAPVAWLSRLADVEQAQVRQVLSIVIGRGLMHEADGGERVQFCSTLVRDVVYEATPAKVRRDLHAAIASVLAESSRTEPVVLGHHLDLAGDLEPATRLLAQAGDHAMVDLDDAGARRLFQRALGAARRVMLSDDDPSKRDHFVMVAIKLADSLRQGGELGLARGLLDEVHLHCQESRSLRAHVLRASAHLHGSDGDGQAAITVLREAIGLAIVSGQRDLLCDLYLDIATTHLRSGNVLAAAGELSEGLDMVTTGEGPEAKDGPEALWRLCHRLAQFYALENRRTDAVRAGEHALRHAVRVGAHAGSARIQSLLATQVEQLGDPKRAAELRRRAVEEMRRLGDRRATAELLLDNIKPTRAPSRGDHDGLREARDLAEEIGWNEGVRRASDATPSG